MLQVTNTSTGSGAAGIGITVGANKAPLTVNANAGKATNLNADKLDGVDSTGFVRNQPDTVTGANVQDFSLTNQDVGVEFAQINSDGTVFNSSGGVTTIKIGTGTYEVDFGHDISNCGFVMTQGEGPAGGAGGAITGVTDRSGNAEAVFATTRTNANVLADRAFQLIVVC
jgi:hypothetical protein